MTDERVRTESGQRLVYVLAPLYPEDKLATVAAAIEAEARRAALVEAIAAVPALFRPENRLDGFVYSDVYDDWGITEDGLREWLVALREQQETDGG